VLLALKLLPLLLPLKLTSCQLMINPSCWAAAAALETDMINPAVGRLQPASATC